MTTPFATHSRGIVAFTLLAIASVVQMLQTAQVAPVVAEPQVNAPATIIDDGPTWTMDNSIGKATILKNNGNMSAPGLSGHYDRQHIQFDHVPFNHLWPWMLSGHSIGKFNLLWLMAA